MKQALVLTNHIRAWGGSEILALEVADILSKRFQVTVCANVVSKDIYSLYKDTKISILENPSEVDMRDFNFIWAQHLVLPLCQGFDCLEKFSGSLNSIHLSPYEPFELAALAFTRDIGANIVANSAETSTRIKELLKHETYIYNLNNAAPEIFFEQNKNVKKQFRPKKICVVSNHIPRELSVALKQLRKEGLTITEFGMKQKNYRRISKEDIQDHDVIISIGKTVQYGILSRRPVFCYDRFGGPGYITSTNVCNALSYNFSGRCCNRILTPEDLKKEILTGFEACHAEVNYLAELYKHKFSLEEFIEKLLTKNTILKANVVEIGPIAEMAKLIRKHHISSLKRRYQSDGSLHIGKSSFVKRAIRNIFRL